ncbi:conserved protein of unknown function (plasmid) [Vibrio tapetis subsp. tapetis]|uniref:Uncharacterized protein n=1 Tax=Vibrio tapetis subsp. tapetis TaxID=1671868 RepID=A0A2N8ZNN4_9VIBR|nr:conserved protein of unknown function [Vibrio tapetis subsp. tapetis]
MMLDNSQPLLRQTDLDLDLDQYEVNSRQH